MPRDYKAEYESFHKKKAQKKNRAKRNAARRVLEKAGRVRKGDGKEVDHKKPLSKGGGNGAKNLRVTSRSTNRKKAAR
tara:strand:+ start:255 stop:488 length:234 start_codon:yes stop_codon:yes gene_type:complete